MTSLHKYIQKHAEEAGYPRLSTVTKPYIQKFLKEQDMKPFKIKYYCEKRDPDFESKMHEVLLVYKQIEMQFKFVFTPKHGSWLNMIESFFSKMTRQMLRGIRVNTKQELEERIYKYFDEVNREPVVYHWKYKMDEISEEEAVSI